MDKDGWQKIIEESRSTSECLRQNISVLSDLGMRTREELDEIHRGLNKTYEVLEESEATIRDSRRLLESLGELRERLEGLMCKSVAIYDLASSELILAGHRHEPGNGKH